MGLADDPRRSRLSRVALVGGWALAGALVVAGIVTNVWRPVAPPIGEPPDPGRWFDAELLARIADYRRPLYVVVPVATAVGVLGPLVVVSLPSVRSWLHRRFGADDASSTPPRRLRTRAVTVAAAVATGVAAVSDGLLLPFRFWTGFLHAGRYGLRTQGLGGWLVDLLLANAVGWVMWALSVAVIAWAVLRLGRAWPLAVGLAMAALSGLAVVVWPLVVEPLRFDFAELSPGATRTAVEEVRDAAGLIDAPLLVADASRRTTRRNAYVSGLFATRRIVLYDTLAELHPAEVAAVVAHEVAHDLNGDIPRGWLLGAATAIVVSAGAGLALRRRAGSADAGAVLAARMVRRPTTVATLAAAAIVVQALTSPAVAYVSRRAEAAADATGLQLLGSGEAFVDLQQSLVEANLSDPSPPAWWVLWRATHPVPVARLHRGATFETAAQAGP